MDKKRTNFQVVLTTVFMLVFFTSFQANAQKKKLSCVGNSITAGYGLSNPSKDSYPSQLLGFLGSDNWVVENFGASGRTLLKDGGYSYWDDQQYKDALVSAADFVVIKLGTNDSKRWLWDWKGSEFKNDYIAFIKSFQKLPTNPEIWIGLLIPGENADWEIFNSYISEKVNPKIEEVALEMGVGLIDLYTELNERKPEWYLEDNVHPSVTGAGVIANKVREILLMPKPDIGFDNGKVKAPDGVEYQWYIDGMPVAPNDSGHNKEMTVVRSGVYKVSVRLSVDSKTRIVSNEMYVSGTTNVAIENNDDEIKIYPNPVSGVVYFQVADVGHNASFAISDMAGKVVLNGKISEKQGEIKLDTISPGVYTLQIKNKCITIIKSE